MSRALQFVLPVFFCIAGFGQRAEAPTPPEAHVLREYKSGANQADPKLEAWLQSIYDGHSPLLAKTDAEFEQALQTWDPASSWLFRLRRNPGIADKNLAKEALAQAQDLNSQLSKHPMYPYVLQALMESPGLDAKDQVLAKNLLLERGALSCPRKKAVLQDLRSLDKASLNLEASRKYLTTLKEFSSLGFLEDSLRALFYSTHQQAQKTMRKEFADVMQPFPRLVADHGWLFDDSSAEQNDSGVLARFRSAEKEASANACAKARDTLMAGIKLDSGTKYLSLVEATAGKIEGCWRAKGDKARILFWQEIRAGLKDIYGFAGESLSERRIGLIHWGRNEFEEARKIFSQLLLKSEKEFPLVHAEALYTYARIVENEGKFDEAVQKYRFFIELYPNNEQSNQALSSLIVLSTLLKHSDDALSYALQLVDHEAIKPLDDRDGGTLPMALYWAGKIYLEKGEKKNAEFFWGRLAQEFYSTFYGALGHYSLERLTHKRFMLPPVQAPNFDRDEIFKEFPVAERRILERAEKLLMAGMKDDAACEIKEIQSQVSDTHRQLAKALFQYAASDWLSAVKIYQNLPKSYRLTLPRGMERVLFPRAFGSVVQHYAAKLNIDPHYINAIIRQESVFNPKAQSQVGARGLMQLMPATAKMEARSIRTDYVEAEKMSQITKLASNENLLNDPEVNIALGVHHIQRLFQKYHSPVFILTSYNANPRATERWLESIESSDMIVFIERIPYRETRAYVKLVMRNYFYYKRWYEGPEAPLPLFDGLLSNALADDSTKQYQASSVP